MTETVGMNAALLESPGAPFRLMSVVRPVPGPGQVLVRIIASGINPLDLKIRGGAAPHAKHPLPAILGIDLAGVVEALGPGVTEFRAGDEVYGMTGGVGGLQGSLADYAAVDARLLALKPRNFSMREAAAVPLVFITAWEGLVDRVHLRPSQAVLVQGGGGGVGSMAIQIARAHGATVYATASTRRATLVNRLGATLIAHERSRVEDYVEVHTAGRGFDVVYDTAGGASLDASFTLLPLLTGQDRAHHGEILREATRLAEAGQIVPIVDERRFDLARVGAAYELLQLGQASGKLVIDVAK
ncbi:MAG: zinc-dependent alcohol dehydrogenase family protein [Steroidobacteraceae bacterium]